MSDDIFQQLENKIQQALDTITLLQLELEENKEKNQQLSQQLQQTESQTQQLTNENQRLLQEQHAWQQRLKTLLSKMEEV